MFSIIKNKYLPLILICTLAVTSVQANVLEDIMERGTLRVGVSMFEPWTIKDEAGNLSGFEVEVTDRLARDMGVKAEYKVYEWQDIIPAVMKGEIDIIAGGMAITPKRALQIYFTRPYAESGISLAANTEKTRDIKKFEELNRKEITIAVVNKTASNGLAPHLFDKATIKAFGTPQEAEQAILKGEVHAWLASMPQPEFLRLRNPGKVDLPLGKPVQSYMAGFGIKKGEQDWLNFLNAWVTARQADKWLSVTHKYWFQTLKWDKDYKQ